MEMVKKVQTFLGDSFCIILTNVEVDIIRKLRRVNLV